MKKRGMAVFFIMTALLILMAGGCGKNKEAQNLELKLDENPTTGYTLSYEIKDKDIVSVASDEYKADDTDKTGAGGVHTYVIKGLKEGETTITFTSAQDWDGGEKGDVKTVEVAVDKDLNVTEK